MRCNAFRQFDMAGRDFEQFGACGANLKFESFDTIFGAIRIEVIFGLKDASLDHSQVNSHVRTPFGTRFV